MQGLETSTTAATVAGSATVTMTAKKDGSGTAAFGGLTAIVLSVGGGATDVPTSDPPVAFTVNP